MEKLPPEPPDQKALPYPLLRDRGNHVASKFRLVFARPDDLRQVYQKFGVDLPKANGDDSWTLPLPARFVIDPAGIIGHADVDPDYTSRSEPAKTVEVLRGLR